MAGINIRDGQWIYGLFLLQVPKGPGFPHGGDVMGCLWREDNEPDAFTLDFRFRYNAGENTDPWDKSDSGDRKSWYNIKFKGPEIEAIKATRDTMRDIQNETRKFFNSDLPELDWLIVRGGPDRFLEACQRCNKSWMHMKTESLPPIEPHA